MDVRVEVSNKMQFESVYKTNIETELGVEYEIEINDDKVSYGIEIPNEIIIGIIFVLDNIKGEILWDSIKFLIKNFLLKLQPRKQDKIVVEIERSGERYIINIPNDIENIEIEIPEVLKLKRK